MTEYTQVAVIGGGPGGICAALAAARLGMKTVLATDRPVLGGNSSSEIRVWTRGATGAGNIYGEEMGIWGELKLRNLYLNREGNPVIWDDVLLEQVLGEPNLTLLLNTHITDVETGADGRLLAVAGFQMGSEAKVRIESEYFIDATGDATLGAALGLPYAVGKESRDTYGETFAPAVEERTTFGSTIFFFTKKEDHPVEYVAPDYAYSLDYVEELLGKGGRIANERMDGCDYWWFETGGMEDTIADAQKIALELKRLVAGVWNYIKNSGQFHAENLTLAWEGNLPGKRESRRMLTKTVLKQQDVLSGGRMKDAAFYGGWYLDFHPSDGIFTDEDFCTQIPVQVYGIPLGCLYHPDRPNLLFAGRSIGASHVAFASTRIMNTCAMSGQAAGTLAAACLARGKAPDLLDEEAREAVCEQLMEDDMLIPGKYLREAGNLAAEAAVSVSSEERVGELRGNGYFGLEEGALLVFPGAAGQAQFLTRAEAPAELSYQVYRSGLPSRLALGESCGAGRISLNAGEEWRSLPFEISKPQDGECFYTLAVAPCAGAALAIGESQLTGFLAGRRDLPGYCYPRVRLPEGTGLYGAQNLTDGYIRPWGAPHSWISAPEEAPWVRMEWSKPRRVTGVDVFFNPDLSKELTSSRAATWDEHHKYAARTGMPPELVREARLWATAADGSETLLAQLTDNWRRLWRVRLDDGADVTGLRLEIMATYGAARAEIFEVRVYGE